MDGSEGFYYAKAASFIGAAIAMGLGSIGPALGQGMIGTKACEKIGQYPESSDKIRNTMIIALAIVESSAVYALLISMFLIFAKVN
jgi:F-type H+-transporting ATPase subunit c